MTKGNCRDIDKDGRFKRVFAPGSERHYSQRSQRIYRKGGDGSLWRDMCRNNKPEIHRRKRIETGLMGTDDEVLTGGVYENDEPEMCTEEFLREESIQKPT